jgi:hypothetical protein
MASGITDGVARVQPVLAMATRLGDQIKGFIRTLGGNQWAPMPGMSGLSARLASTLRAASAFALAASETIGRRRLRGRRRVLLPERELTLQVRDAFGLLSDLALTLGQLSTQPFNFLRQALLSAVASLRPVRSRHASDGTPIASICTAP